MPLLTATGNEQRDPETGGILLRDSWRPQIKPGDRNITAEVIRDAGFRNLNELVRWRLYRRTGGGLMVELGSHQLDACSIFLGKRRDRPVHPISVTAFGGKHFYTDDRQVEDHVYCVFEFPGKEQYVPNRPARDAQGHPQRNDIVTVTYSSISTNNFEGYGECVMGNRGTLVVEGEQTAMLYGTGGRDTAVTVSASGGRPALDASATGPAEQRAQATGQASLGHAPPSRGYREEMEHLAYCIRMRAQGMERDRENLQPRCDGRSAMEDAVMALTANKSIRTQRRIEFNPRWFDPATDDVPDEDMREETV
jgi:predicted dehydrogenase